MSTLDVSESVRQMTTRKKSMVTVTGTFGKKPAEAKEEDESESEGELINKKIDYTLPTTASEVFRANYIMNKTLKKKKNVTQWIPDVH